MSELTNPGSYTPFTCINKEAKKAFNQAIADLSGVGYEPFAASSQVVAGTNYRVLCNATVMVPNAEPYLAMITVFQPLSEEGKAEITNIEKLS